MTRRRLPAQVTIPTPQPARASAPPVQDVQGYPAPAYPQAVPQPAPVTHVTVNAPPQSQALPAIASFFVPGLGHLIQGRVLAGLCWFIGGVVSGLLCFVGVGLITTPILCIACIISAAKYKPRY